MLPEPHVLQGCAQIGVVGEPEKSNTQDIRQGTELQPQKNPTDNITNTTTTGNKDGHNRDTFKTVTTFADVKVPVRRFQFLSTPLVQLRKNRRKISQTNGGGGGSH